MGGRVMDLCFLDDVAGATPIVVEPSATVAGRVVHIDGDMLCYVAGGNKSTTVAASRKILQGKVAKFINAAGAESAVLHLTASGSLKGDRALMPIGYQNHRKSARRPENWQYLRDWLTNYEGLDFKVKQWFDREADDGFGYVLATRPLDVIATNDKDMRRLSGLHLDWDALQLVEVPANCFAMEARGKLYGYKWFLLQLLQGDDADDIRGLGACWLSPRGVGSATAEKWLEGVDTKEEGVRRVVQLYRSIFGDRWGYELAQQAILLWIRQGKSALLDEFLAFMPLNDHDRADVVAGVAELKAHVKQMKDEAAALCR